MSAEKLKAQKVTFEDSCTILDEKRKIESPCLYVRIKNKNKTNTQS